jgi:hypothetical protein
MRATIRTTPTMPVKAHPQLPLCAQAGRALLCGYLGSPHIEVRPLSKKVDVVVMDLSSLDGQMGVPHIRGAAAGIRSLEEQGVSPGFPADYPQIIEAVHRIGQVNVRGLRTRPASGRIGDHKLSRGGASRIGLDADVQGLGGGSDWGNGQGRGDEKADRQPG